MKTIEKKNFLFPEKKKRLPSEACGCSYLGIVFF